MYSLLAPPRSRKMPGYNPNGTVCALAYLTADAIVSKYLKSPGPLVQT